MDKALITLKLLIALAVTVLAGCARMPIPIGMPCTVGPVILDKGASTRLTRDEKEQIVSGSRRLDAKRP